MKRKPDLSKQWERLMRRREKTIAALVRIEQKANKLRRSMARRHRKQARAAIASWNAPITAHAELNDELAL
jgi:hypothetical protein